MFAEGQSSDWDAWIRPLLVQALSSAPLDFGDVWGVGLRYALYHLSTTSITGFRAILEVVSRPVDAGKQTNYLV